MRYEVRVFRVALLAILAVAVSVNAAGIAHAQEAVNACARADALRKGGQPEAARFAYINILVQAPSEACALAGIKELDESEAGSAGSPTCAAADALRELGYDTEAKAAYQKALEADAGSDCARSGLEELKKGHGERFIAWTERAGKIFTAALFIAGVVLAFLVIVSYWLRRSDRRPAPRVRRGFQPTLGLEPFKNATGTATDGDAFTAAAREALAAPDETNEHRYSLNAVITSEGLGETIAKLGEAVAPLKAAGALVGVLQAAKPTARFAVHGTLRSVDSQLAASTFLEESGRSRSADTLIVPSGLTRPLDALAVAVAGWTQHAIQTVRRGPLPFQTGSSASYGFLRAGKRVQDLGNATDARSLYVRAIELDAGNAQARSALAIIDGSDLEQTLAASDQALLAAKAIEEAAPE